jgi:nitronate monooxygenase
VYETGDLDAGVWSAGLSLGLIDDIPTVAELVERILLEAEQLIRGRLEGTLAAA